MFEFLEDQTDNAVSLIKDDHKNLKDLFDEFEITDKSQHKTRIAQNAIKLLKLHAAMEEQIFYPAAREWVEKAYLNEAEEEHHVAKILVAEIDAIKKDHDLLEAKFTVLAESVRHHIQEEENNILPAMNSANTLDLKVLGKEMLKLRRKLMKEGFPVSPEEKMVQTRRKSASANGAKRKKTSTRMKSPPPTRNANGRFQHSGRL